MRKLVEIRNDKNVRACDLVREDDDSLCYHMKCRDNKGNTKAVIINVSDVIYPAIVHMTERERAMFNDKMTSMNIR